MLVTRNNNYSIVYTSIIVILLHSQIREGSTMKQFKNILAITLVAAFCITAAIKLSACSKNCCSGCKKKKSIVLSA